MTKPTIQKNQAGWFDVIYKGDTFPCPNWAEAKKVENVIFCAFHRQPVGREDIAALNRALRRLGQNPFDSFLYRRVWK